MAGILAKYKSLSAPYLAPEKVFLALALAFGVFWTFIVPPFQAPDEQEHVRRALELSEGHFYPTVRGGVNGNEMPASLPELVRILHTAKITFRYDEKQDVPSVLSSFGIRSYDLKFMHYADKWSDDNFYYPCFVPYPPTLYMPQMAAYRLSKLAGLPLVLGTYLMRISNLLLWAFLVYFSIKIAPVAKWGIFVLALMPMGVFEAASASADPAINGTAFLYTAFVLRHALDEKQEEIGPRTLLLLFILPLVFCVGKVVYLPITMLPLMIPARSFGGGFKKYLFIAAVVAFCGLVSYKWEVSFSASQLLKLGGPDERLRGLLAHPSEWFYISLQSFWGRGIFSPLYAPGILGWLDTPLGKLARYISVFLIFAAFITGAGGKDPDATLSGRHRIFMLSLAGISTLLIVFALTVPFGPKPFYGLQGRYFIPLGPLVFTVIGIPPPLLPHHKRGPVAAFGSVTAFFLIIALLVSASWKLILRYYAI